MSMFTRFLALAVLFTLGVSAQFIHFRFQP